jgi:hypothetical protein
MFKAITVGTDCRRGARAAKTISNPVEERRFIPARMTEQICKKPKKIENGPGRVGM